MQSSAASASRPGYKARGEQPLSDPTWRRADCCTFPSDTTRGACELAASNCCVPQVILLTHNLPRVPDSLPRRGGDATVTHGEAFTLAQSSLNTAREPRRSGTG